MRENKILSSLCYFSIFFAPFLFPIIVYFLSRDDVKEHAKKSLWTHLIPYLIGLLGMNDIRHAGPFLLATYAVTFLVAIYFFIWNIVKGIKVFSEQ
ncbi:DUF4870 domain-containing protein [Bacillus velezensis]|uniref:DUF4870 domain-containing protein n=1 Tax=Bacillus velezensis TaxID=492670 RepID=UPI000C19848F|nr:DUF4870 domain-containing protein [Bacillus velezensis]PII42485.1 DUF4870 domain-containing protein [Bacillus velezensis]